MGFLKKKIWYIEVVFKLGLLDVLYVFYYRLCLKTGRLKKKFPAKNIPYEKIFFTESPARTDFPEQLTNAITKEADLLVDGNLKYYSYHQKKIGNPPDWFLNPFNQKHFPNTNFHWTELPDFNNAIGDIKNIWEPSRFGWAATLARAYAVTGNAVYLHTLNNWIVDWTEKNPLNVGPNWKCGQETSIRLLNVLTTAVILQQDKKPSASLVKFVECHVQRIEPTIRYALAQRNNHATSELTALFVAFNWLRYHSSDAAGHQKKGNHYQTQLEKIVNQLVYPDGSFSQHSITYHRLFIDTVSLALFWSKRLATPSFSNHFKQKIISAINWLTAMLDEASGDCPNLGANDGVLLLNIHSLDYRNFKPSLQLCKAIYQDEMLFADEAVSEPLYWLEINKAALKKVDFEKKSKVFACGYSIMQSSQSWALCRFPYFKFRPSHNDVLHFDLWYKGKNILMDSGSYSYNPGKDYTGADLKSVHAHNTVSFDGKEQMPRLSRFLLAKWIAPLTVGEIVTTENGEQNWSAAYKDYRGNFHQRKISWANDEWSITDDCKGPSSSIELVFNFDDDTAFADEQNNNIHFSWGTIHLPENVKATIKEHFVSKYYWQKTKMRQLGIVTGNNIVTSILIKLNK